MHWRDVDQIPVNSVQAVVSNPDYGQPKSLQQRAPVAVIVTVRGPYTPAEGNTILSDLKHELVKYPDTQQTDIEVAGNSGNAPPNIRPGDTSTDLVARRMVTANGNMLSPSRYPVTRKDGYSYSITKRPPIPLEVILTEVSTAKVLARGRDLSRARTESQWCAQDPGEIKHGALSASNPGQIAESARPRSGPIAPDWRFNRIVSIGPDGGRL